MTALGGVGDPGFDGGSVSTAFDGGGGGGSGGPGGNSPGGGAGGPGFSSDILGSSETFAAGGNKNGSSGVAPSPVTANRGAGSGGALNANTIAGADGCFIIRVRR